MSVHQGDIIRKRVDESGISVKEVATRIGRTRSGLYAIFERAKVSADLILKIGHAIRHDFTDDFKNLREMSLVMEPNEQYGLSPDQIIKSLERELLDCKAKCFDLMEENALLLSGRLKEYFKKFPVDESAIHPNYTQLKIASGKQ